ncbi:MAG: hypothetical protein J7L15_04185 [Clostridiales bacterium]|nr:hypothetical protein [Clostridiales bacterium]
MNWYKPLIKYANPKNQIQKYQVKDPSLKTFIYKYEKLVQWAEVDSVIEKDMMKNINKEKENYVQNYIKSKILPQLQSKIDPKSKNNNYLKDIDIEAEAAQDPDNAQVQQALAIYRQNPEGAKKTLLNIINGNKQREFNGWWDYLNERSDIFKENPAFIYTAFKPILDSSTEKQKTGVLPLNEAALAILWDDINNKGMTDLNFLKRYKKITAKLDKESLQTVDTGGEGQWIQIPSKKIDPQNYEENKEKLKRFSSSTCWCVAGENYANRYLSQGDFWLYLVGGVAKVAIRLVGNKVAEIRPYKDQTTDKALEPFWEPITNFLTTTNFDYKDSHGWKVVQQMMMMNAEIEEGDTTRINTIIRTILADPKQYGIVSDVNKKKFPQFKEAAAKGYGKNLNRILKSIENIPPVGYKNMYSSRFSHFQDEYNEIPTEIKPLLPADLNQRVVEVHHKAFQKNPTEFEFFPEEIQATITTEDKLSAWTKYVSGDPYRYNDPRLTPDIRQIMPKDIVINGWMQLINENITHVDNMPKAIRQKLPADFIQNKIIDDFVKYPFARRGHDYYKLEKIVENGLMTEEEIVQLYADHVQKDPEAIYFVPPMYKQVVEGMVGPNVNNTLSEKAYAEVLRDPKTFGGLDPTIRQRLVSEHPREIGNAFAQTKRMYGNDLHGFWISLPQEVKTIMPDDLVNEMAIFYAQFLNKNMSFMEKIPVELQAYALMKMASYKNWFKMSSCFLYNY